MEVRLSRLAGFLAEHSVSINSDKTQVRAPTSDPLPPIEIEVWDRQHKRLQVEEVEVLGKHAPFLYLGVKFTLMLDWEPEVAAMNKLVAIAKSDILHSACTAAQALYATTSVLHAQLSYHMQVAEVSSGQLAKWDSRLRSVLRNKGFLPKGAGSAAIHARAESGGWGLRRVTDIYIMSRLTALAAVITAHTRVSELVKKDWSEAVHTEKRDDWCTRLVDQCAKVGLRISMARQGMVQDDVGETTPWCVKRKLWECGFRGWGDTVSNKLRKRKEWGIFPSTHRQMSRKIRTMKVSTLPPVTRAPQAGEVTVFTDGSQIEDGNAAWASVKEDGSIIASGALGKIGATRATVQLAEGMAILQTARAHALEDTVNIYQHLHRQSVLHRCPSQITVAIGD